MRSNGAEGADSSSLNVMVRGAGAAQQVANSANAANAGQAVARLRPRFFAGMTAGRVLATVSAGLQSEAAPLTLTKPRRLRIVGVVYIDGTEPVQELRE